MFRYEAQTSDRGGVRKMYAARGNDVCNEVDVIFQRVWVVFSSGYASSPIDRDIAG